MIILDRFEGNYAILEVDGTMQEVLRSQLSEEVREGDVLKIIDNRYYCDKEETSKRKKEIEFLLEDLWEE